MRRQQLVIITVGVGMDAVIGALVEAEKVESRPRCRGYSPFPLEVLL
jgi:hypothetical protein